MRNRIVDAFGRLLHYYATDNLFTLEYTHYERDVFNGRCYYLVESTCLRADCDGKLVKRRISQKEYLEALSECKAIFEKENAETEFEEPEQTTEEPTEKSEKEPITSKGVGKTTMNGIESYPTRCFDTFGTVEKAKGFLKEHGFAETTG